MKYVVDSLVTDGPTSSGPHGISLSTTMDDDVFMDGTLREVEEKTPDSQDEVSERSLLKVSPGAVRQEVSQAIIDKRGTLIILKEADDRADAEGKEASEEPAVSGEGTPEERGQKDITIDKTIKSKTPSPSLETETNIMNDLTRIRGIDSPKKAMALWITEEVKTEPGSEVVCVTTKEVNEEITTEETQQKSNIVSFAVQETVQTDVSKSSVTLITVSESSTATLAVVLYEKHKPPPLHLHRLPLPSLQQSQSNSSNECMANSLLTPAFYSDTCQTTSLCCN